MRFNNKDLCGAVLL